MSIVPDNLRYASTHEWVRVNDDGIATVGISYHAQNALGDIIFIELPELDTTVSAKDEVAVVESVKAASTIYSPVSGEVIAVTEDLLEAAETVNSDPYAGGWFYKLRMSDEAELDELMDADAYTEHCNEE